MTTVKTRDLVLIAEFAAITAVLSQIILPLPFTPIAISLGTLAVLLTGGLLGPARATATMAVYLLLGGFGVPVFQGFRGGPAALLGPTGGYLVGYVAAAWIIGMLLTKWDDSVRSYVLAMTAGSLACYALGTAWFMVLTGRGLWESLLMCVFPFLIGDALKIIAATLLCRRLRRHIA